MRALGRIDEILDATLKRVEASAGLVRRFSIVASGFLLARPHLPNSNHTRPPTDVLIADPMPICRSSSAREVTLRPLTNPGFRQNVAASGDRPRWQAGSVARSRSARRDGDASEGRLSRRASRVGRHPVMKTAAGDVTGGQTSLAACHRGLSPGCRGWRGPALANLLAPHRVVQPLLLEEPGVGA